VYTTRQIQAHLPFRTQKYLYVISQFYLILALSGIHVTIYSCPIRFLRHNLTGSLFRFVFPSFLCQMRPNRDIFISCCDSGLLYIYIYIGARRPTYTFCLVGRSLLSLMTLSHCLGRCDSEINCSSTIL